MSLGKNVFSNKRQLQKLLLLKGGMFIGFINININININRLSLPLCFMFVKLQGTAKYEETSSKLSVAF